MTLSYNFAPAQLLRVCAGVVFVALAACDRAPGLGGSSDRTLALSQDTIQLAAGVHLHDVQVRAVGTADFKPDRVAARPGDVLRFTVADTRTHALVISPPNAQAEAALLDANQLRSPPLVSQGQAWVVSLKGLPTGNYAVSCLSHAGTAFIVVQ